MYIPHHFKNTNTEEVESFIRDNGFGLLISSVKGRPHGTHIPLELSEDKTKLLGHVSRANPQWKNFDPRSEVLAIFSGPHTYVSASWYDHENVSTWNYIAVHVYGKVHVIEGEALYQSLKHLLDKYEQNTEKPVKMEHFSPGYIEGAINGLVGFEIEITEIQACYKLSQNRNDTSYHNIIDELEKGTDANAQQIARIMKNNRP